MDNFLGRSLWTLFLAVLLCGGLYDNSDRELGNDLGEHQQRFRPDIAPTALPTCLITILIVSIVLDFKYESHTNYFSYFTGFISIFLHIGVYYLILTRCCLYFTAGSAPGSALCYGCCQTIFISPWSMSRPPY